MGIIQFILAVTISSAFIMSAIKLMDRRFGIAGVYVVSGFTAIASATFTSFDSTTVLGVSTNVVILLVFWTGATIDYVNVKYGRPAAIKLLNIAIIMNIMWAGLSMVLATFAQPSVEGIPPISVLLGKTTFISTTLGLAVLKITQMFDIALLSRVRARWSGVSKVKLGIAIAVISMASLTLDTVLFFGGMNAVYGGMGMLGYSDIALYGYIPFVFTLQAGLLKILLSAYGNVLSGLSIPYLVKLGEGRRGI